MGADFGAAVGGAAGFGQPSAEHLAGQGHAVGQLRFGTNHGAAAALRVGDGEGAPVHGDGALELNVHQGGLSGLVRLLRFLEPLGVIPGFGAGAEHSLVDAVGIITVGKALAVKGGVEAVHHLLGDLAFVNGLAVHAGDGGHIFRPLHPAFQLQGGHAHGL